ncbi:MAG: hypothetical protein WC969_00605 [Elusimicrobiota bacterium]|jgi:hypothetical protein
MKKLFLIALALAFSAPARSQSIDEIFGVDPGQIIAEAQRQQAKYEAELEVRRAKKQRIAAVLEFINAVKTPKQDERCVLSAVVRHMNVGTPSGEAPDVYRASRTILEDYQTYYYAEISVQDTPKEIKTTYFPLSNIIFMEDAASAYDASKSIDDAIAGQFALYVQYRVLKRAPSSAEAQAAAAEVVSWFHATYTAQRAVCR